VNNTYGIEAYPPEVLAVALGNLTAPDVGCLDLIKACRAAAAAGDPDSIGNNPEVNTLCGQATAVCFGVVQGAYTAVSGVSDLTGTADHLL
jgi:hypothetical protein